MSHLTEQRGFVRCTHEHFAHQHGVCAGAAVQTPMIRKDFTVDEYQIYQAKLMGADAVLLICAILDTQTIARYLGICETLGLTALVEAHDAAEIIWVRSDRRCSRHPPVRIASRCPDTGNPVR